MNHPRRSHFTANLITLNQWQNNNFHRWLLKPGMGFTDQDKWWGDKGVRPIRHEGLDLTGFRDDTGGETQLAEGTIVPPLYEGKVVNIIADFLGSTVIIDHRLNNQTGQTLHGFYAHLTPTSTLAPGAIVRETEELGTIAAGSHICPPHLHISTVWISQNFPTDQLSWTDFTEREGFRPCDPSDFL